MDYRISEELLTKVLNFIAEQPYKLAAGIIQEIQQGVTKIEDSEESINVVK